jgi:integrase
MAIRSKHLLTAAMIKQAKKPGYLSDGGGLVLQVSKNGAKSWLFRYRAPGGKIREMGLGSSSVVSLADARKRAEAAQRQRSDGHDPIEVKRQRDAQLRLDAAKGVTFRWCAEQFIETNASGWQNEKHAAQWSSTLEAYAYPVFGTVAVASVDTALVTRCLEPIGSTKSETASRVRQRVERVLSWATVRGYRVGANPAAWRGHLDQILPKPSKVRSVQHHRALPIDGVPGLMGELAEREGGSALALRFLALTATRTGEVIGAKWPEIDLTAKLWTIPADRMKAGKEHRIPLSREAIDILREAQKLKINDVIFFGQKPGRPLSNMAFAALLKRMKRTDFVPHGLRSTFRTWAAERTNYPREVCEMALAHAVGNAVEQSYQRGDMFERRKKLMADWAKFATIESRAARSSIKMREEFQ